MAQLFPPSRVIGVEDPDEELVERALDGDRKAFSALVERYQRPIYNAAFRVLGREEDAKDVVQTVFVKVAEHLGEYDERRKFFSWIYRIAVNECINERRSRRTYESLDERLADPAPDQEEQAMRREVAEAVQAALQRLPEADREVLVLRHWLERSYAEIADALGLPESTVKSRLFEARQRLGRLLRTEGGQA